MHFLPILHSYYSKGQTIKLNLNLNVIVQKLHRASHVKYFDIYRHKIDEEQLTLTYKDLPATQAHEDDASEGNQNVTHLFTM